MSQVAHKAGAYPGLCSMKRLGIFLLPPGWDASPSQGYTYLLARPLGAFQSQMDKAQWITERPDHNTGNYAPYSLR